MPQEPKKYDLQPISPEKKYDLQPTEPPKQELSWWDKIFSPIESIAGPMREDANKWTDPHFQQWLRSIPAVGPQIATGLSGLAGVIGGMPGHENMQGMSGMMTPMNLALAATPVGEELAAAKGIPQLWNAASGANRILSAATAARGVQDLTHAQSSLDAANSVLNIALGGIGMRSRGVASALPKEPTPGTKALVHIPGQGTSGVPVNDYVQGPRFVGGQAGVADTAAKYQYDLADPIKARLQELQLGKDESFIGKPTVLPHEIAPGMGEIPHDMAARGELPVRPGAISIPSGVLLPQTPQGLSNKEIADIVSKTRPPKDLAPSVDMRDGGTTTSDITNPEDVQFARTKEGNLQIGADIKSLGKVLGSSLYQGNIGTIATKELLQNSVDAVRSMGDKGHIHVSFDNSEPSVVVRDNGPGLTRAQLETVFTDLGSSGKRNDENAVGGFGLAKAAPLLGGKKVEVVSRARERNGTIMEHQFSGTPEDLLDGKVRIQSAIMPSNTPTGMTVKTHLPDGTYLYEAKDIVKEIAQNSPGLKNTKVTIGKYSHKSDYGVEEIPKGETEGETKTLSNKFADVDITVPKDAEYAIRNGVHYQILNNGMWQAKEHAGSWNPIPGLPDRVLVNIRSKVPEGHADYPFTANRESLRGDVKDLVHSYINDTILGPAQGNRLAQLKQIYEDLPELPIASKGNRSFHIYNAGGQLSPEELSAITNNSSIQALAVQISDIIDEAVTKLGGVYDKKLEKVGLILDDTLHGIHIPNPGEEKSAILINPFATMVRSLPDNAAANIFHTILHEIAHIPGGGHDEGFTTRLGDIYGAVGAQRAVEGQSKILSAIEGANPGEYTSAEYNPEVQNVLQTYSDASGRPKTEADPLMGTGIGSRVKQPGEGKTSGGSGPSRERAIAELRRGLNDAITKAEQQKAVNSSVRGQRIGRAMGVKGGGLEGLYKQLGMLKGEIPRVPSPGKGLNLGAQSFYSLLDELKNASNLRGYERIRGQVALSKLVFGKSNLQPNEIGTLQKAFPELNSQLEYLHGGLGLIGVPEGIHPIKEAANFSKAVMASIDLSGALRQGVMAISYPEYWRAFVDMHKMWGSEAFYKATMDAIKSHPDFEAAKEAGVLFTDIGKYSNREEQFYSKLAEMIPGVRASERAFTGFLNKIRMDVFSRLYKDSKLALGDEGFSNPEVAHNLGEYINNITGRGSLGQFERISGFMNNTFFSARMQASMMKMLNPLTYINADPLTRKAYLRSWLGLAGVGLSMTGLAKMFGGSIETDPRSSDFLKARFGNTRVDWMRGFQQPLVAAMRIVTGESKDTKTGQVHQLNGQLGVQKSAADALRGMGLLSNTPVQAAHFGSSSAKDIAENFAESKASPIVSFALTMLAGKDYQNLPVNVQKEVMTRITPMVIQDMYALSKENPSLFGVAAMAALGFYGMGLQTYGGKENTRDNFVGTIR